MIPLTERPAPNITAAIDKAIAVATGVLMRHALMRPDMAVRPEAERCTLATHAFLLALRAYQTTLIAEMEK